MSRPSRVAWTCAACSVVIELPPSKAASQRYCSRDCYYSTRFNAGEQPGDVVETVCAGCTEVFSTDPKKKYINKYCSVVCRSTARSNKISRNCESCGSEFQTHYYSKRTYCRRLCSSSKSTISSSAMNEVWTGVGQPTRSSVRMQLWVAQKKLCAICEMPISEVGFGALDHDHNTGAIRGVLCGTCNSGIGMLKDSPEILRRAAVYIEISRTVSV